METKSNTTELNVTKQETVVAKSEPKVVVAVSFEDNTPCNWVITPEDDDIVTAVNNVTGERFTGTMEAFNEAMKG
jgi:hypothetical protein